ncbi:MAG: hypothetical protein NC033_02020, partial [Clostridiales bacterium]|nr:hypothetical protein [Clostridiales bacterium]
MTYGILAADKFFPKLVSALTSKVALIIYITVILVLVVVLAIRVMLGEQERVEGERRKAKLKEEAAQEAVIDGVSKKIDKHFERIGGDLNYVKRNLANAAGYPAPVRNMAQQAIAAPSPAEVANGKPDEDINTDGSRFYMLTQIDKEYESYVRPDYDDKIGLKELCEDFRNFSAGSLHLYYDIEDIRRFIGGLAVTKLIILQGMSGTGKTSLAYAFGEYLDNKTVVVPIQPMWKERTDLLGYYNE